MTVIVRANGESFPASRTPISGSILVDVSHVFGQITLTCVRTGTVWAREALGNVFSPGVIRQRADVLDCWTQFSALVWFRKRWRVSSHTRSILSTWQGGGMDHRATSRATRDHRATSRATRDHMVTRDHLPNTLNITLNSIVSFIHLNLFLSTRP